MIIIPKQWKNRKYLVQVRDIGTVKRFDLSFMLAFCGPWIHRWSEILILVDVSASGWFKLHERCIVPDKDTEFMSTNSRRDTTQKG